MALTRRLLLRQLRLIQQQQQLDGRGIAAAAAWSFLPAGRHDGNCRRHLSSSSSSSTPGADDDDDNRRAREVAGYLKDTLGVDPRLHGGMVEAVGAVQGGAVGVSQLEGLGREALLALAASVEREMAAAAIREKDKGRKGDRVPSVPLRFAVPHHRFEVDVKWRLGESLLDVARGHGDVLGEYLGGTCGGQMSCCTCHLYVTQPELRSRLPPPDEAELDMLDLAYEPRETSRLGCQVRLTRSMLEGDPPVRFEVELPGGVNDVWN